MGPELIIGLLVGLLVASLAGNVAQFVLTNRRIAHWRFVASREADGRHAAELRRTKEIDTLLDRIGTSPRIELREPKAPAPDLSESHYISDFEYQDRDWNEYRGEPEEAEQT